MRPDIEGWMDQETGWRCENSSGLRWIQTHATEVSVLTTQTPKKNSSCHFSTNDKENYCMLLVLKSPRILSLFILYKRRMFAARHANSPLCDDEKRLTGIRVSKTERNPLHFLSYAFPNILKLVRNLRHVWLVATTIIRNITINFVYTVLEEG